MNPYTHLLAPITVRGKEIRNHVRGDWADA